MTLGSQHHQNGTIHSVVKTVCVEAVVNMLLHSFKYILGSQDEAGIGIAALSKGLQPR